jgi:hypothetical protein
MCLKILSQFLHLLSLPIYLMDQAMHLKTVDGKQTQPITENVEVILVVSLAFVKQTDLELFFSLI